MTAQRSRRVGLGRHLVAWDRRVRTATRGITAAVILDRRMAGETAESLADDYEIPLAEVLAVQRWVERLVERAESEAAE